MGATAERRPSGHDHLVGSAAPSPAGPVTPDELAALRSPPEVALPRSIQVLRFSQRQIEFVFKSRRELGEVFRMRGTVAGGPVISGHPDHARSLFTAPPELVPSLTAESPLRPIVGPASVLTANGPRHLRQRKLLLPSFHGEAIERYTEMIAGVAEREIDRWPSGEVIALAPQMQAITLEGLAKLGCPKQVVWGERDPALGEERRLAVHDALGLAQSTLLPAKHFLQDDVAVSLRNQQGLVARHQTNREPDAQHPATGRWRRGAGATRPKERAEPATATTDLAGRRSRA